jgi:hypothetical protein
MTLNEELLYYVWTYKAFDQSHLLSHKGESIKIIHYGHRNLSSGPDFQNCKIELNGILWAGNIEMHILSSDWIKHNHDADDAYKNVILHVVYENDNTHLPDNVPILELKNRIDINILTRFDQIMESTTWIPCENNIHKVDLSKFSIWCNKLVVERLARKIHSIIDEESYKSQHWDQLLHEKIARYFGSKENSDNFQTLAQLLPINLIRKVSFDSVIVESLVFGTSGYLDESPKDDYHQMLAQEYLYQKQKYSLSSLRKVEWKNFGMFPIGQPTFRLAQFASYLKNTDGFFDKCLNSTSANEIKKLFTQEVSEYWQSHYQFGKKTESIRSYTLSAEFIDRIIINAIIPVLFAYAQLSNDDELIDKCLSILESIPAEKNTIITKWKKLGLKAKTAAESQALLQLKNHYCDGKQCLKCNIGLDIMKI